MKKYKTILTIRNYQHEIYYLVIEVRKFQHTTDKIEIEQRNWSIFYFNIINDHHEKLETFLDQDEALEKFKTIQFLEKKWKNTTGNILENKWKNTTDNNVLNYQTFYKVQILAKETEIKTINDETFLKVQAIIIEEPHKNTWMTTFLRVDNLEHMKRFETAVGVSFTPIFQETQNTEKILEYIRSVIVNKEFYARPYIHSFNISGQIYNMHI